jgi:MoxR-like ATPase
MMTDGADIDPADLYDRLAEEIGTVLIGNTRVVEQLTIALLTRGHILLEGVPGVAKTTLANLFARATGLDYARIQMTPDLLPADITGTHVYREASGEFELERGPVFANVVLADEINRASPKTQSALLEAMQEEQVTIEGQTLALPDPFMLIATQNPLEMEGVFGLPIAQRDRFQFKLQVEIPERAQEGQLLDRFDAEPGLGPEAVELVVRPEELRSAREAVFDVHVADSVKDYVLDLVEATRESEELSHGASPRAGIQLLHAAKAEAALSGRSYVIPDDVKALFGPVMNHRLVLHTEAELSDVSVEMVIEEVLAGVEPPGAEFDFGEEDVADVSVDGGSEADGAKMDSGTDGELEPEDVSGTDRDD